MAVCLKAAAGRGRISILLRAEQVAGRGELQVFYKLL